MLGWAPPPNDGLSPPMLVRKGVKFEEKSDSIRILIVAWALFTSLFAHWPPQSIWKRYTVQEMGFPNITREQIGRSSRNLVYLTFEQFYIFPENVKPVPTMTFDLWPDFQGNIQRNLCSVPFQRLKLANVGIFAGDMDMNRCYEVYIHCLHWHCGLSELNRGHRRSMTFDDVICHFRSFVLPRVIWCAAFEFGIRLSFIYVEIRSLGSWNTPKNDHFYHCLPLKIVRRVLKASHCILRTKRNVLVFNPIPCGRLKITLTCGGQILPPPPPPPQRSRELLGGFRGKRRHPTRRDVNFLIMPKKMDFDQRGRGTKTAKIRYF